jgi:hypothetical protein
LVGLLVTACGVVDFRPVVAQHKRQTVATAQMR